MVFYRKYRPQTIEELDSKDVREKLYSVLGASSVAHAFLFTGPKGLGKTSTARIVAKVLNCEATANKKQLTANKKVVVSSHKLEVRSQSIEPCNKCNQCVSITNGNNLDVLEIDGASNRGIDEIRDLREKVKLSPASARKKVYIIDEVHMLTTEAFNALLKTLEEPPPHVVFILCTTEPHKVPLTILSRCLNIQFKKATEEELVRSFERIVKKEELEAEKGALQLIAGLSDGSFRDGVKILEEMSLVSKDKKITKELVEKKYLISSIEYQVAQMIKYFQDKNTKSALEAVAKLTNEGIDLAHFMQGLIGTLHNILLFKAGVSMNSEFIIHNSELTIEQIKKLIEMLSSARSDLKYAVLPQIPLELVIVGWGIQNSEQTAGPVASFPPASAPSAAAQVRAVGSPSSSTTPRIGNAPVTRSSDIPSPKVTQQDMAKYSENGALWTALIDKIKAYNHSVAGVLRGCNIKSYDSKSLILETNFKFHKDKLSEIKTREVLENALREITKKNVKIEVILKPAKGEAKGGEKIK